MSQVLVVAWLEFSFADCQSDIATPRRVVQAALRGLGLALRGNPSMSILFDPSSTNHSIAQSFPWPREFADGLPPQTARQIEYRVKRLSRAFGLRDYDIDEIRGMFMLALYKGLAGYDQSKSSPLTFAKHVIQMAYVRVALTLRGECELRRRHRPLSEVLEAAFAASNCSKSMDRRESLDALNRRFPKHRDVMFDLARMSPAEVARHNGVHRGTVSRQIAAIRQANCNL